jgi:hypothetical protein
VCITIVGFKGDKGVLMFPSRKGYINDKFGLEFDMLAARFDFSVGLKVLIPFNRYFKDKKQQEFKPVLFVGDSMIRFLTNVRNHVNVISLGGVKILHVLHVIETQLAECFIFVLVIHVGTNSVNKIHIPEKSQLSKAKQDLDVLFAQIRKLQNQHRFAVVFSGCVYTKSQIIKPGIHDTSFASKSPFKFLEFKFFDRVYHTRNLNQKT